MTIRVLVTAVGIALLLANPGWAQSTTTSTTTTTGSFERLSTGNQKIANALFSAQNVKGTSLTPLTKNQIADLKGTEGWGRVFKEMKADGLIQAKNLGQVVSKYQHTLHASTTSTTSRGASTTTATTRSGRSTTRTGSSVSSAGITDGRGVATGSQAGGGSVATTAAGSFGHGGMGGGGFGGGHGGGGGHGR
jgi:hypothetical protein